MGIGRTIAELVDPSKKWERMAGEADEVIEAELLPAVVKSGNALPSDVFDSEGVENQAVAAAGGGSVRVNWSQPPKRGGRDLLASYLVSPPIRSVVHRVVEAFGAVKWFVPGPNNEQDFKHPAINVLNGYNPLLIGSQGRELEQLYMELLGESITIIAPGPSLANPIELFPVPPTAVTIETVDGERRYRVHQNQGGDLIFTADEVIHQRVVNPLDPYGRGFGLGFAVGDEIETDEYASKHAKAYYYNSGQPEFIGILAGASTKKLDEWREHWDNRHKGFRKHWRPAWINQVVDIKELTKQLGTERIERLRTNLFKIIKLQYGVPPEIMGDVENSNRATAQAAVEIMARFVTDPRCIKRKDLWNSRFAELFGVQVDYVSPIPKNFDRRDEIMSRHPYAFLINEIRQEAGFTPHPDGNVFPVPLNISLDGETRAIPGSGHEVLLYVVDDEATG